MLAGRTCLKKINAHILAHQLCDEWWPRGGVLCNDCQQYGCTMTLRRRAMSDRAASSIYVRGACGYNRNLDQGEACSAAIRSKTFATFQTESPVCSLLAQERIRGLCYRFPGGLLVCSRPSEREIVGSNPGRHWRCLKNCYWNGPFQYNVAGPTYYGRWGFPG